MILHELVGVVPVVGAALSTFLLYAPQKGDRFGIQKKLLAVSLKVLVYPMQIQVAIDAAIAEVTPIHRFIVRFVDVGT